MITIKGLVENKARELIAKRQKNRQRENRVHNTKVLAGLTDSLKRKGENISFYTTLIQVKNQ